MNFTPLAIVILGLVVLARVMRPGLFPTLGLRRARSERATRHTEIDLLSALATAREALGDERMWRDLDLDEVFHSLDYAASEVGRQCLYARLRQPLTETDRLIEFGRCVTAVADDNRLGASIRESASALSDRRSAFLVNLLFGDLPKRPPLWWTFPILSATALVSLAVMPIWPRAFMMLVAVVFVNIVMQVAFRPRMKRFVPAIHELPAFLRAAEATSTLEARDLKPYTSDLNAARGFRALRRAAWWLMFEPDQGNELATSIYEYVNLVLLLDLNAFIFATEIIRAAQPELQRIFLALGELDVMQSVATWRATLQTWSTPTFAPRQQSLDVVDVFHPLLAAPVANSLTVNSVGVLVTGSNMSGKTTFIRTLGVNAVLAQTLFTVCARGWNVPPVVVRTSIGRADSITEGKSYYLAEAESVRALLFAKDTGSQHLFLLDEIFRGTNTGERMAAAYGVLRRLAEGDDLVFVATHDVELLEMLEGLYVGHHFAEQVSDSSLTFDYRLRPGPSSTRNAIALLRLLRYPEQVVSDALSVLDQVRITRG